FGQKLLNWREVSTQRWEDEGEDQQYQFIETEVSRTLRIEPGKEREVLLARGTLAESGIMSDYFRNQTDLPLQAAGIDYWASRVPAEQLANITPAALGLGLWRYEDRIPTLDLLNRSTSKSDPFESLRERFPLPAFDRSLAIAGTVSILAFILGMGATYYWANNVIGKKIHELKTANAGLTSMNAEKMAKLESLKQREAADKQILELMGESARPNPAVTFFTQVNDIVPPDSWLTAIDATTPTTFVLKGSSLHQQAGLTLAQKVSEFQEVDQVKVTELSQVEPGRYAYVIDVSIDPTAVGVPLAPPAPAAVAPLPATDSNASGAPTTVHGQGEAMMKTLNNPLPDEMKKK
ncbi:MAG: hypothetical protein JWM80_5020, partial [Cyanobacteria bacterium RYN_339]|nr:hypothetical protein [Cyanobacteria bacterium RYN_339]